MLTFHKRLEKSITYLYVVSTCILAGHASSEYKLIRRVKAAKHANSFYLGHSISSRNDSVYLRKCIRDRLYPFNSLNSLKPCLVYNSAILGDRRLKF